MKEFPQNKTENQKPVKNGNENGGTKRGFTRPLFAVSAPSSASSLPRCIYIALNLRFIWDVVAGPTFITKIYHGSRSLYFVSRFETHA